MVIVRLKKVRYTLKLNNMIPMVASWGGHSKVACGFANGRGNRDHYWQPMETYMRLFSPQVWLPFWMLKGLL